MSKLKVLNPLVVKALLASNSGKIVTVTAYKKDGTLTKQNGILRPNPASYVNSPHLAVVDHISKQSAGYVRSFDKTRVIRFAIGGTVNAINNYDAVVAANNAKQLAKGKKGI